MVFILEKEARLKEDLLFHVDSLLCCNLVVRAVTPTVLP